jgi:hypothetical protein
VTLFFVAYAIEQHRERKGDGGLCTLWGGEGVREGWRGGVDRGSEGGREQGSKGSKERGSEGVQRYVEG